MVEITDGKRKCSIEGCDNLGEWNKIDHCIVHRRKLCSRHKRLKYNLHPTYFSAIQKFKMAGKCNKCELCGWVGPCDCHRRVFGIEGGRYKVDNLRSICPNCHRLIHRGIITL